MPHGPGVTSEGNLSSHVYATSHNAARLLSTTAFTMFLSIVRWIAIFGLPNKHIMMRQARNKPATRLGLTSFFSRQLS